MSMILQDNTAITGTQSVPSTPSTEARPTEAQAVPSTPSTAPAPSTGLPDGYLADGTMLDADGILLSAYLGEYAQQIAALLKPLPASTFHRVFLKETKPARKKSVPYEAKKTCAAGMIVQARKLVHKGKNPAPAVLLPMIGAATATVHDAATFEALYLHLDAVYSFLLEGGDRL